MFSLRFVNHIANLLQLMRDDAGNRDSSDILRY